MAQKNQEPESHNNVAGVLAGLLIGSLAGAIAMLLLAPQSGKDTRMQIRGKGIELRERTSEMVQDSMAQVRSATNKLANDGREKIQGLKQHGQELAVEQLDRVSEAAKAGKKALQNS